jgi:outer membrane protein assembly factor BamB
MSTILLLAALLLQDADWPAWRGPRLDGSAAPGQDLPLEWTGDAILWKTPVPGRGHGSPAVRGSRVYLAACDEATGAQSLLTFDRETGAPAWETVVHPDGAMRKNPKSTGASCTPAVDADRAYITFASKDAAWVSALSPDGVLLWQTRIGDYQVHQGYASSPHLFGDFVYAVADHKGGGVVAAVDRKTGTVAWSRPRGKAPNYTSPIVHRIGGRDQLILTGCDAVTSYDPLTGKTLWETAGATTECVTTTVSDGARVFSSGGYPKNHVAAYAADGSAKLAWERPDRVYVPSFLLQEGRLYGVLDAGLAACWDSATGQELWKGRLGGTFSASPVLVDGRIYAANEAGQHFVFKASPDGFEKLAEFKLGDEAFGTPAVCGGRAFTRIAEKSGGKRQEFLVCVGKKR